MTTLSRMFKRNMLDPEHLIINLSLTIICIVALFPVIWVISASFKTFDELYKTTPSLIVRNPTLANYQWMLTRPDMSRVPLNLWNSFKVAIGAVVLQCIMASMAGFAFARLNFRGRDLLFYLMIILMFIPRAGGLMAIYELMAFLKLRNSHMGLMLLFSSTISVALFIMRQNFLGVPREVEDSALIDGANTWRLFWNVDLPFARGGVVVVAIFQFVYVWGEYLITLTLLDFPELETISIAVTKLRGWADRGATDLLAGYGTESAAFVSAMIPVILVFILMQKYFVRGLTEGVLKM
jgi:ABC-type glycerol-3-phosphate transport system permease component